MKLPDFFFEKEAYIKGFKLIAGVDEVGRGCFAGPVVAGCVLFGKNTINTLQVLSLQGSRKIIINDSKQLSPKQRDVADRWIRKNAVAFGVGTASVTQINKFGIKKATEIAFRKAIAEANRKFDDGNWKIDYLLVDAFHIPRVRSIGRKNQMAIIKGDVKSLSIAAASIVAKVCRDRLMVELSHKYGNYQWDENKGYGTKKHRKMIQKYGLTKHHRKLFVKNCVSFQVE